MKPGPLWRGKTSFAQRWQLWKQRFGATGQHDEVDEYIRRFARDAKCEMEVVENDGQKLY